MYRCTPNKLWGATRKRNKKERKETGSWQDGGQENKKKHKLLGGVRENWQTRYKGEKGKKR